MAKLFRPITGAIIATAVLVAVLTVGALAAIWPGSRYRNPTIDVRHAAVTVERYNAGKLVASESLKSNTPALAFLQGLLESKKGKWNPSLSSFAPQTVFRAESFRVNVQSNRLIVNWRDDRGTWTQLVTALDESEVKQLEQALP